MTQRQDVTTFDWTAELHRHRRWLRTVLLARCGDGPLADELLQELALAVVRRPPSLRAGSPAAPWLYRVAVRQWLMYRRRTGRRRRIELRYATREGRFETDTERYNPVEWILGEERRRLVRAALAALPPRDAEILLLKHTEDWTYRQLADHLGVTEAAVESRLHRARQRLRTRLSAFDLIDAPASCTVS